MRRMPSSATPRRTSIASMRAVSATGPVFRPSGGSVMQRTWALHRTEAEAFRENARTGDAFASRQRSRVERDSDPRFPVSCRRFPRRRRVAGRRPFPKRASGGWPGFVNTCPRRSGSGPSALVLPTGRRRPSRWCPRATGADGFGAALQQSRIIFRASHVVRSCPPARTKARHP